MAAWVGPAEYAPKPRPYLERIRVRNFRCIQEVDLRLTPIHALIGPNDSGKSTLLAAFAAIKDPVEDTGGAITVLSGQRALTRSLTRDGGFVSEHDPPVEPSSRTRVLSPALQEFFRSARVLRLDPDAMLRAWLAAAHDVLTRLVHGRSGS